MAIFLFLHFKMNWAKVLFRLDSVVRSLPLTLKVEGSSTS